MKSIFDEIIPRENTACVKYDKRKQVFGREDVMPFWVADMDFKAPEPVIQSLQKKIDHGILGYPLKPDGFYESITSWLLRRHGWEVKSDWILFTPGVVPSMVLSIYAFTNPGDRVLLQSPVYFPFFTSIKNNDRAVVCNLLQRSGACYEMDFDDIKSKFREGVKMILLCSPHNPVGRVWKKDELTRLVELCLEFNVRIVSDEIHSDIIYQGNRHIPLASLGKEAANLTITCMAPSKSFNLAGMASSFVIIPEPETRELYAKTVRDFNLEHGNIFGLEAMNAAYAHGEAWLDELLPYLWENIVMAEKYIKENLPEIGIEKPEGTCLLWLDFNKLGMDRTELNRLLVHKAGIGLSDGHSFGPGGEGFQRLNVGCPRSYLRLGLERLRAAVESLR
jgi:cystathionine beta-lyase